MVEASRKYLCKNLEIVDPEFFLNYLKNKFDIKSIYYPGSDTDFANLEGPFEKSQIVYLDSDHYTLDALELHEKEGRNILIADAAFPPFRSKTLDAIFVQDMHAEPEEFDQIVDVLKPRGILIFSTNDCGGNWGTQLEDVRVRPDLKELSLPVIALRYSVFQKLIRKTRSKK